MWGVYDVVEMCELVGIYLLYLLSKKNTTKTISDIPEMMDDPFLKIKKYNTKVT